ncbi:flavodoxin family protein [Tenacibaculum jejuense]|uniref:NADPH-dependent FMN reductase n=1 Tax=Tenacibaculum jejuense TaxID=584609 RepID=A0A238U881_9FLAO|nr:NAD(P)H-dependent oxidoreductase [Tenacibaculum jejuense]SNR15196.1 NADPH-dependent FMN reductase [Tenacibaculum jejuense]
MNTTVIIKGSSKKNGNTQKIIDLLNVDSNFDVIDLLDYNIGHFDYDFKNVNDDFLPLLKNITEKYNTIIFATPIYWYTMSGILKVFFDRLSDLLYHQKDLGRKLRGKNMAMVSNSGENDRRQGFEMPFIESAKYLGMNYLGDMHVWFSKDGSKIDNVAGNQLKKFKETL